MTRTIAREIYVNICNNIWELIKNGVSEDAPVIVDLRAAAEALDEEYKLEL